VLSFVVEETMAKLKDINTSMSDAELTMAALQHMHGYFTAIASNGSFPDAKRAGWRELANRFADCMEHATSALPATPSVEAAGALATIVAQAVRPRTPTKRGRPRKSAPAPAPTKRGRGRLRKAA
jgi:hypothetical protein